MKRALVASIVLLALAASLPFVVGGLTTTEDVDASTPSPPASSAPPPVTETPSPTAEPVERAAVDDTPAPARRSAAVASTAEVDDAVELNATRLERALAAAINDYRDNPIRNDAMDDTLATDSTTARRLDTLARTHSARMARLELAAPTAGGTTPASHYDAIGLDSTCRIRAQYESYLHPLSDLELVTSVDPNGANETVTATAVVDRWFAERASRETLTIRNADHLGTGVAAADGVVYVTVALC